MRTLVISSFPPRRCGIADYTSDMVRHLLRERSFDITVLTYRDGLPTGPADCDGVSVLRDLDKSASPRRLNRVIKRVEPDLIHVQSSTFLHKVTISHAVAESRKRPVLTTIHDAPESLRTAYVFPALRGLYDRSSCLVTHSTRVSNILTKSHKVDSKKITNMPLGVDTESYRPDARREEATKRFRITHSRIVLFSGFLRPGKGIETLLNSWAQIEKDHREVLLVIAGGSPTMTRRYSGFLDDEATYPRKLEDLVRQLSLTGRVLFTDYVPEELCPGLFAAADVIVLPYEGNPSQSYPLQKALSSGKPIITSDVPGFREVLQDGNTGLLVPPKDSNALASALERLLGDDKLSQGLGRRAREYAERRLCWSATAKRYLDIYSEIGSESA